jgi:hypothetical protein
LFFLYVVRVPNPCDVFHTKVKQNVTWRSSRRPGLDKNEPVTTILGVPFYGSHLSKFNLITLLL